MLPIAPNQFQDELDSLAMLSDPKKKVKWNSGSIRFGTRDTTNHSNVGWSSKCGNRSTSSQTSY